MPEGALAFAFNVDACSGNGCDGRGVIAKSHGIEAEVNGPGITGTHQH